MIGGTFRVEMYGNHICVFVAWMTVLVVVRLCFYCVFLTGEYLHGVFNMDAQKISRRAERDPN